MEMKTLCRNAKISRVFFSFGHSIEKTCGIWSDWKLKFKDYQFDVYADWEIKRLKSLLKRKPDTKFTTKLPPPKKKDRSAKIVSEE